MKKILALVLPLLFLALPAQAAIVSIGNPPLKITSPDTLASVAGITCDEWSTLLDYSNPAAPIFYYEHNCSGTPIFTQYWPVTTGTVSGLSAALAAKLDVPSGTAAQYLDGTGAPRNFAAGSRTFNYPSRALNSCFQIDNARDADFHYKVDVSTALSLTTGAQGTVTLTSYSNSGCTTGARVEADATSSLTGALVVGLGISAISSVPLDGTLQGGRWAKITTANTVGTPTFAIRANQAEIILQ